MFPLLLSCCFLSSPFNPLLRPDYRCSKITRGCRRRVVINKHTHKRRRVFLLQGAPSSDTTSTSSTADTISDSSSSSSSLSDVDSRVLQSMLQDPQFLNSIMKDNIQQLLTEPRAEVEQTSTQTFKQRVLNQPSSSEYTSTLFKSMEQLDASQLFNSIKAKADEFIESFQILVSNRVERDLTLLTSLGVFAWQRIVKDVGRALPSSGRSSAAMAKKMRDALFQLTSNSSFISYISKDNFILPPSKYSSMSSTQEKEENVQRGWNSPLDEIKSVTAAIRDILAGKTVLSLNDLETIQENRGLKSVAPAGYAMNSERQRRAYQRKKEQILNRQRETVDAKIGRVVSSVSNTVWEITREFQAEGNEPGYRVDNFVRSIQGSDNLGDRVMRLGESTTTSKKPAFFLEDPLDLTTSKSTFFLDDPLKDGMDDIIEENIQLEYGDESMDLFYDNRLSLSMLQDERTSFAAGIRLCLEQPQNTWLVPEVVELNQEGSETSLRNVISTMILSRDNVEVDIEQCESETDETYSESRRIIEFQKLKQMLDSIVSLAAAAAGSAAADRLKDELIDRNGTISLLESILERQEEEKRRFLDTSRRKKSIQIAKMNERSASKPTMVVDAEVEVNPFESDNTIAKLEVFNDWESNLSAEIQVISDDEYINSLNLRRTSSEGPNNSSEKVENPVILVTLRAFDLLFFALEKAITIGLPTMLAFGDGVKLVLENVERNGMGRRGWQMLRNLKNSKYAVDQ